MHRLLERQLRRYFGTAPDIPLPWQAFLDAVDTAYGESDVDRAMLERSLELSSQELVDANSEMRAVCRALPDLVLRLAPDGTILDAKGCLPVGSAPLAGRRIEQTELQPFAPQFLKALRRVVDEGASVNFEYSANSQAGQTYSEVRMVPLLEAQVLAIVRDVSERKRAEERVQHDLLTLQRSAVAAQVIARHQSLGSILQVVADQVRSVIGVRRCRVSAASKASAPHMMNGVSTCETDSRHGPSSTVLEIPLTDHKGWAVARLKLSDKYGSEFTAQDHYVVKGLAQIAATTIENATLLEEIRQLNADLERKVIDRTEALRQQEALFQAAAEQAPQVVWIVNAQGAVTYLNRAWYELVGGAPPKWHGNEWMEAVPPEDVAEMRRRWDKVKTHGGLFAGNRRVRASDGTLHTLSYRASPVLDAKGRIACWIGMDADITEIKAIEGALRLSNRELESFSYSVSHDLRAPLSAIDGFSQALAEHLDSQDKATVQHYLSRIRGNVSHMGELIDSLLALAQVSRSRLNLAPVNLSEIADSVLCDLRARSPDRKVSVTVEPELMVLGDARLLAVAVENLLANAWKFTSRTDDARIAVGRISTDGVESTLYISDNGAGFDMKYADKLFGTFQRLHTAQEFPGTGVGLATVRRVVARHCGRVWAESEPGNGATFFLTLPTNLSASLMDSETTVARFDSRFGLLQ
jgi:PAS domain S-box-containing protein